MMELLNNYDLDIIDIEEISKGYAANKWLVKTDDKKYILKELNTDIDRVEYILEVIDKLKNISPNIYKTKDNMLFTKYNDKYYYLSEYINNKGINNIYEIGLFLGILYKELSKINNLNSKFIKCNDNYEKILEYLEAAKNNNIYEYINILEYKKNLLESSELKIDFYKLEEQIIHGDFYIDNILYDDRMYIIDFDQCCNFYKEYEVMRAMFMISLNDNINVMLSNMKEFIRGYKKNNDINSCIDAYNLYLYVQANSLSSLKSEMYNNIDKRNFAIKRDKILRLLCDNKNEILEILNMGVEEDG